MYLYVKTWSATLSDLTRTMGSGILTLHAQSSLAYYSLLRDIFKASSKELYLSIMQLAFIPDSTARLQLSLSFAFGPNFVIISLALSCSSL